VSEAEEALAFQLRAVGIPFEREVHFARPRKWRADFRIRAPRPPALDNLLVEVDGGAWTGGRHTSGSGFEADAEKASAAAIAGYRVIRCTPRHVETGECLRWIELAR
jgi:very-short-patch-repair endonuclease